MNFHDLQTNNAQVRRTRVLDYCLLCLAFLLFCLLIPSATAQEPQRPAATLTEIETLKHENLQLKLDSLDKQARLLEAQYREVKADQNQIAKALLALDQEILSSHGATPGSAAVNWQSKKIEPVPKAEEKK